MKLFSAQDLIDTYIKKGYSINKAPYQPNIFGIRNSESQANTFDDAVGIFMKDHNNNWIIKQYGATTDPGTYYRLHPMNVNGTAIIIPGQYINVYGIGMHNGYKALAQIAPISYIRDNTKTGILHWTYKALGFNVKTSKGVYTENGRTDIHHAGLTYVSGTVDNWSAGCQVIDKITDFNEFLNIIESSVKDYKFPNLFTYTLLELTDFNK